MPIEVEFRPVAETYTNVVVGAASTLLCAANTVRKRVIIINRSDEMVDCKSSAAAVAGEGIPLNPVDASGNIQGAYEWSNGRGNGVTGAIYGICASGTKTVSVIEDV